MGEVSMGPFAVLDPLSNHMTLALGSVTNTTSCPHRYLSYTLNPELIRKQDVISTLSSIASNVIGQSLAWDFIQSNWKKLFEE